MPLAVEMPAPVKTRMRRAGRRCSSMPGGYRRRGNWQTGRRVQPWNLYPPWLVPSERSPMRHDFWNAREGRTTKPNVLVGIALSLLFHAAPVALVIVLREA